MRISSWQNFKSWFVDILLEKSSSPKNKFLELYLSKSNYKLCASSAVYSYGLYYYNFRQAFEILKIKNYAPKEILILGLGTGSIIQILEKKYQLKAKYTCVEIDEIIIQWYQKYVSDTIESDVSIVHADAFEFMATNKGKYDLICMDIFIDDTVPELFESISFGQYLRLALSHRGILIFNRIAETQGDQINNQVYFNNIFQRLYTKTQILKLRSNWMFIAEQLQI